MLMQQIEYLQQTDDLTVPHFASPEVSLSFVQLSTTWLWEWKQVSLVTEASFVMLNVAECRGKRLKLNLKNIFESTCETRLKVAEQNTNRSQRFK
ncbi:hypothetical protein L596_002412 [Steinernema carpocapsae]|uniref:Uncharacterized protein n=1 Tax=Steinernema carpocapsae TaxID=34508 RepID=A0A4U8UP84_STECR|nr:hypothetical protein L596_002412 [Steinernema carpocapsae]